MRLTVILFSVLLLTSIAAEVYLYNLDNTATGYSFIEETAKRRAIKKAEKDCPNYKSVAWVTNGYSATIIYECDK